MLTILRILFTGALVFVMWRGSQEGPGSGAADTTAAYYMGLSLILAIGTGIVWAPAVGAMVVAPLDATLTCGSFMVEEHKSLRLVYWLIKRKHRRLAVFFCLVEAVNHPDWPTAYNIGMRHAKRGSRLERIFAKEVWRFDNAQNALLAHEVLRRHGVAPPPHTNSEVMWQLTMREKKETPMREPIPVPPAASPPPLKRNPLIKLYQEEAEPSAGDEFAAEAFRPPTLPSSAISTGAKPAAGSRRSSSGEAPPAGADGGLFGWLRRLAPKR
ncbi:MAG: hypothetical protein FJ386_06940 [Verrucomicrobia bacterium]|nr:hypothetical protein [Verrucomicrobiota bacterium]